MDIKKFGLYFLLFIIVLLAIKFYTIINVFFPSIATGFVLAYLFRPLYNFFLRIVRLRVIAGFMVLFLIFVLVLIPLTIIIIGVQSQVSSIFTPQTADNIIGAIKDLRVFINHHTGLNIPDRFIDSQIPKIATAAQNAIAFAGPKIIITITEFIIFTFVTFFIMYYVMINSKKVVEVFRDYFPLSYRNVDILLSEMGKKTKILLLGQLLIATIQGTLGAVGFFIFGLNGVFLWGIVMVIMSFIPLLGSVVVWLPASLYLISQGNLYSGLGLICWGAFVVGTIDNIIRPKLTSSLGEIHPVTVLLGVFIGLKEWGIIGLVLGPLIIAVLMSLIKMFREEYITGEQVDDEI